MGFNSGFKGLMELFTATGKLESPLPARDVRCVHHGWHGTHRYDIQALVTHAWRPLDFCLHRHPVSVNCLYHARIVLSVGGSFEYFARNARCTVTIDLLVWYSNTQNDFFGAAIFSLYILASPRGRNVNYDEKELTGGKNCWVVPSIYTGFINMCPTGFL
jgi:hypothetical protein